MSDNPNFKVTHRDHYVELESLAANTHGEYYRTSALAYVRSTDASLQGETGFDTRNVAKWYFDQLVSKLEVR